MTPEQRAKWASVAERAGRAFFVAFLALYLQGGLDIAHLVDVSVLEKAANAGLAALADFLLSMIGGNVGNKDTPSLLPKGADPTTLAKHNLVKAEPVVDAQVLSGELVSIEAPAYPTAAEIGSEVAAHLAPLVAAPAEPTEPEPEPFDLHLGRSGPRGQWPTDLPREVRWDSGDNLSIGAVVYGGEAVEEDSTTSESQTFGAGSTQDPDGY